MKFCIKDVLSENCNYNKLSRVISEEQLLPKIYGNDIPNAEQCSNRCILAVVRGPMCSPTHISEL